MNTTSYDIPDTGIGALGVAAIIIGAVALVAFILTIRAAAVSTERTSLALLVLTVILVVSAAVLAGLAGQSSRNSYIDQRAQRYSDAVHRAWPDLADQIIGQLPADSNEIEKNGVHRIYTSLPERLELIVQRSGEQVTLILVRNDVAVPVG